MVYKLLFTLLFLCNSGVYGQIQLTHQALLGDFTFDRSTLETHPFTLQPYGTLTGADIDAMTEEEKLQAFIKSGLLQEAAFVFSGLIYGFTFTYVPSDIRRQVKEEFILTPRAVLKVGDNSLEVIEEHWLSNRYSARIRYHLKEEQMIFFKQRSFGAMSKVSAYGYGNLATHFKGRLEALHESAKEAIRAEAVIYLKNKPRSLSGEIFIDKIAQVAITAGQYRVKGSFILKIAEIEEHYLQ